MLIRVNLPRGKITSTHEVQGLQYICSTFHTLCPFGIYTPALSILFCWHKPWLHIGRWCRWQALNNLTGSKANYNKNSRLRTLAGSEPNRIGWWAPEEIMPSGQAVSPILCCMYEKFSDIIYRISLPLTCTLGMLHPLVRCRSPRTPPPHHSPKASGFLEQLPIHLLVKSPPRSTTLDTSRKLHRWRSKASTIQAKG